MQYVREKTKKNMHDSETKNSKESINVCFWKSSLKKKTCVQ